MQLESTISLEVFFVSDRTGITAENLGHALLTQFSTLEFEHHSLPFIDSENKARYAASTINETGRTSLHQPLVFSTLIDDTRSTQPVHPLRTKLAAPVG